MGVELGFEFGFGKLWDCLPGGCEFEFELRFELFQLEFELLKLEFEKVRFRVRPGLKLELYFSPTGGSSSSVGAGLTMTFRLLCVEYHLVSRGN